MEGREPKAKIQVERMPDPERVGRTEWTAAGFDAALLTAPVSDAFRRLVARLKAIADAHPDAMVKYGSGALGSITLFFRSASILSLYLNGRAETKPRKYLESTFGSDGANRYQSIIAAAWGKDFTVGWRKPTPEQTAEAGGTVLDGIESIIRDVESGSAAQ